MYILALRVHISGSSPALTNDYLISYKVECKNYLINFVDDCQRLGYRVFNKPVVVKIKTHKNKEIRAAIKYAVDNGWEVIKAGGSAHCFCKLRCGIPDHRSHTMSVWSTPVNPVNHAKQIRKKVDECNR